MMWSPQAHRLQIGSPLGEVLCELAAEQDHGTLLTSMIARAEKRNNQRSFSAWLLRRAGATYCSIHYWRQISLERCCQSATTSSGIAVALMQIRTRSVGSWADIFVDLPLIAVLVETCIFIGGSVMV